MPTKKTGSLSYDLLAYAGVVALGGYAYGALVDPSLRPGHDSRKNVRYREFLGSKPALMSAKGH